MSRLALALLVIVAGEARAGVPDRVLLADSDPQLVRAVRTSLSPWSIPIIVALAAPVDVASARTQASASAATFVVWRASGELVIFDATRDSVERRPSTMGPMDPVGATSVALTLKTIMRLPAEVPAGPVPTAGAVAVERAIEVPRIAAGGPRVRLDGGVAVRLAPGSDGGASTRGTVGATVRPWATLGIGFGVRGDFGSAWSVESGGFSGRWHDWSAVAAASWTFDRGVFEIEPWIGAGVARGTLSGTERGATRVEHQTGLELTAGCAWTAKLRMLRLGAALDLGASPSARTYRAADGTQVFATPGFALQLGLVVGGELGR